MTKELPSPELLRKLLRYEPDTGNLFWLERSVEMFSDTKRSAAHSAKNWNSRFANKKAFTAVDAHGYRVGNLMGVCLKSHRVAWAIYHGEWPEKDIDHINQNRSDNSIKNLRSVTRSENLANSFRKSGATSKYRGVRCIFGKWHARISDKNKQISLGHFETEKEAAEAYDRKAIELWGSCAQMNLR